LFVAASVLFEQHGGNEKDLLGVVRGGRAENENDRIAARKEYDVLNKNRQVATRAHTSQPGSETKVS